MEPPPPPVGGAAATMGVGHLGASPTPCRSGGAPSSTWDPAAPPPHRPGIRWHPLPIALLIRWRPLPIPIISCAPSFGARSAGSNAAAAHVSPFSSLFSSASAALAIAPHDARDSGLGGLAYWAWIHVGTESAPALAPPQEEEDEGPARYILIKAYFLSTSIADHEGEYYLDIIRKHALGWLPETRKDDYAVVEKPSLTTWMKGGLDYIVLKSLDTDGICIISSVLGQSITLDHYIRQVDDMVEEFTEINRVMEKTGNFTMQIKKTLSTCGEG
ncbi:unnamed protein product [Miscanthus lutarioriparius]|uniref:DUF155 domain-containing protein n=1 Tax=Miscanthus lutarioriparius TaxID=422564 RepID=A0A811RFC4_9POAL|nr:unnamed protein product [Miscanthus lutarioriparius]